MFLLSEALLTMKYYRTAFCLSNVSNFCGDEKTFIYVIYYLCLFNLEVKEDWKKIWHLFLIFSVKYMRTKNIYKFPSVQGEVRYLGIKLWEFFFIGFCLNFLNM